MILKVVPIRPHDQTNFCHSHHYIEGSEFAVELRSFKDEEAYVEWLEKRTSCTGITNHSMYTRLLEFADVEQVQCFAVDVKDLKDGSFDLATYTILCKTMYLLNSRGKTVDTFNTTNPQSFPKPDPSRYKEEDVRGFTRGNTVTIQGKVKKNKAGMRAFSCNTPITSHIVDNAKLILQYIGRGQKRRRLFATNMFLEPFGLLFVDNPEHLTITDRQSLQQLTVNQHLFVVLKDTEDLIPYPSYNKLSSVPTDMVIGFYDFVFKCGKQIDKMTVRYYISPTKKQECYLRAGNGFAIRGALRSSVVADLVNRVRMSKFTLEHDHSIFGIVLDENWSKLRIVKDGVVEASINSRPKKKANKPSIRVYPWDQRFSHQIVDKAKFIAQYIGQEPRQLFKNREPVDPFDLIVIDHPLRSLPGSGLGLLQHGAIFKNVLVILKDTENIVPSPTYGIGSAMINVEQSDFVFKAKVPGLSFTSTTGVEFTPKLGVGDFLGLKGAFINPHLITTLLQCLTKNFIVIEKERYKTFGFLGEHQEKLRTVDGLIESSGVDVKTTETPLPEGCIVDEAKTILAGIDASGFIKNLKEDDLSIPVNGTEHQAEDEDDKVDDWFNHEESEHNFNAPKEARGNLKFTPAEATPTTEETSKEVASSYPTAVAQEALEENSKRSEFTNRVLNDSHVATVTDTDEGKESVCYSVWQNTTNIPREDIDNSFLILQNISIQTVDLRFGKVDQPVPGLGIVCIRDTRVGWVRYLKKAVKEFKWSIIKDESDWFEKHIVKSLRKAPRLVNDAFAFENIGKISVQLAVNKKPLKVARGGYAVWRGPLYAQDLREMHKALVNLDFRLCNNTTSKLLESLFKSTHTQNLKALEDLTSKDIPYEIKEAIVTGEVVRGLPSPMEVLSEKIVQAPKTLQDDKGRLVAHVYEHDNCSNFDELQKSYLTIQNATLKSVPMGTDIFVPGLGIICFMVPFKELSRHLRYVLEDEILAFKWLVHEDEDGVFADPHGNSLVANYDYATHYKDATFILQNVTNVNTELPLLFSNADKFIVSPKGYFVWDGPLGHVEAFKKLQELVNKQKFELVYDNTGTVVETLFNLGGTWFPKTPPMCSH